MDESMRKQTHRKHTHASVPMLVNRLLNENVETLQERAMIMAFQYGVATKQHYDYLVRMANMMNIANQLKPCDFTQDMSETINHLAAEIQERYNKHGKFGVSAHDLTTMRELAMAYDDYWKRQTTNLYNDCAYQLNAFYEELASA
jgi:hypothetical protein